MKPNSHSFVLKLYFEWLPKVIRKIMWPYAKRAYPVAKRLCDIISDIFLPVTLYESKRDTPNFTLLAGGRGEVSSFFLNQICPGETEATSRGTTLVWKVSSLDGPRADAIIIEADRCFSRLLRSRGFLPIPGWVLFTMDVTTPVEEIFRRNHSGKNDLRKIRKNQYVCEVADSLEKLNFFYHKMYLPHVQSRFGKLALTVSLGYMENLLERGELLLVKKGREYTSGALIETASPIPVSTFLGVTDGRWDYVKQGALSAVYYYAILWAKGKGHTTIDFGHCRPLLNDGVFAYKRTLGMMIQRSPRKYRTLHISIHNLNEHLEQFLLKNPLVYEDRGELKGALFFRRTNGTTEQDVEKSKKQYAMSGLEEFSVTFLEDHVSHHVLTLTPKG